MKHTPGPWHRNIKPAKKYNTIFAGSNTHVAYLAMDGFSEDEIEANCNLIAAAPDLLSTLKQLLHSIFDTGTSINFDAEMKAMELIKKIEVST